MISTTYYIIILGQRKAKVQGEKDWPKRLSIHQLQGKAKLTEPVKKDKLKMPVDIWSPILAEVDMRDSPPNIATMPFYFPLAKTKGAWPTTIVQ